MKKECVAMLLAGGQGSRLYVLTGDMAKPAVPFGGKFRIIDFPLSNCANSGIDTVGVLKDLQAESEMPPHQRGNKKRGEKTRETYAAQKADKKAALLNAFHACNMDGVVTLKDMAEYLGISEKTVRRRVKDCGELTIADNSIQLSKVENNGGTK